MCLDINGISVLHNAIAQNGLNVQAEISFTHPGHPHIAASCPLAERRHGLRVLQ
jgi:hypothetical protein